jgi:glycogen synthase
MHVALISFEYPPAVAIGGIGTYAGEAARMLADAGMRVSVFAAGKSGVDADTHSLLRVHRIDAEDRRSFSEALVPALLETHLACPIDVIEAPEIGAEGLPAFRSLPNVARVVKLHTPGFLLGKIAREPVSLPEHMRFTLGALIRGRFQVLTEPRYDPARDDECTGARLADVVSAPSRSIAAILTKEWSLNPEKIDVCPLPFSPSPGLLALPVPSRIQTIGFLGRLEPRKGVVELVEAIPGILREAPGLRFRFIGPSWPYRQTDMKSWIQKKLGMLGNSIEFTGGLPPSAIPGELARCDAVILPSRWENFPFACWESLASGRPVIGSSAGGMSEVITPGNNGLLVSPRSSRSIREAILSLAADPVRAAAMGAAGRAHVVALLDPRRILPLQLAGYRRAIEQASRRRLTT